MLVGPLLLYCVGERDFFRFFFGLALVPFNDFKSRWSFFCSALWSTGFLRLSPELLCSWILLIFA